MTYDRFRGDKARGDKPRGKRRGGKNVRGGKSTGGRGVAPESVSGKSASGKTASGRTSSDTGFGGRVPRQTPLEAEALSRDGFGDSLAPEPLPDAGASTEAKFDVGQRIYHRIFDYRGLIFDVDPSFQGTQEWYEKMARSRPPQDEPWYHVLVHDATHTTYVAEQNLEVDSSDEEVDHPLVPQLFDVLDDGAYRPHQDIH